MQKSLDSLESRRIFALSKTNKVFNDKKQQHENAKRTSKRACTITNGIS